MNYISVIIPTHNSEKYIRDAINSALIQKEIGEVIIVDDASDDTTCEIVENYILLNSDKIRLIKHTPNSGAAVTRNLGIKAARFDIIGFLDSDDYYLPGRFINALEMLKSDPNIDGVYECIGTHYQDEEGRKLHEKRMSKIPIKGLQNDFTTITEIVPHGELYEALICGGIGWFHFNGLTLRNRALEKAGLLNPLFRYGQDIELFFRLARKSILVGGSLHAPVAMRRVYADNGTLGQFNNAERYKLNKKYNALLWKIQFPIMLENHFNKKTNRFILNRYLDHYNNCLIFWKIGFKRKVYKGFVLLFLILRHPKIVMKIL